jgi:malonate transporter and related proteins
MLESLVFSVSITGPIFIVMALGVWLNKAGHIDDHFVDVGSKLVFNITLPALLFINVANTPLHTAANPNMLAVGIFGTLIAFLLLEKAASRWIAEPRDRGVVVQGGFRANMGIIGLAYSFNAYGNEGLAVASIFLGIVTIVYNVLSVITLSRWLEGGFNLQRTLKGIAKNPIILSIVAALPLAWFELGLPSWVERTGSYFAQMTLPLALLCTGASLPLKSLRNNLKGTLLASTFKLILVPVGMTTAAVLLGIRGMDLGVLAMMIAGPTAAASYVMVRAMGGDAKLAATIIASTTLGSIITNSALIGALHHWGWL